MIRPLRIRHRRIFTVLGVLLPVAFGLGIAARSPVPRMNELPAGIRGEAVPEAKVVWQRDRLFSNVPVQVRLLWDENAPGPNAISCTATGDFAKPDLLVYWSPAPDITDTLPEDAMLLGAFAAPWLKLPADATIKEGVLILFSLADQEVVAVSGRVGFNDSGK